MSMLSKAWHQLTVLYFACSECGGRVATQPPMDLTRKFFLLSFFCIRLSCTSYFYLQITHFLPNLALYLLGSTLS